MKKNILPQKESAEDSQHVYKQVEKIFGMSRRDFVKNALKKSLALSLVAPLMSPLLAAQEKKIAKKRELYDNFIFLSEKDTLRKASWNEIKVRGKLPLELNGALFRNGPGIKDFYGEMSTHFFDGHGVISAFYFNNGRAHHLSRVTETYRYKAENEAKRHLYMLFGTPVKGAGSVPVTSSWDLNQANINAMVIDKKLWALNEASGFYQLDPKDLSVVEQGFDDEEFKDFPFTAHPRIDEKNGAIFAATYILTTPGFIVYRLDAKGNIKKFKIIAMDESPMIHDSVISEKYFIVLVPPYTTPLPLANDTELIAKFRFHEDRPMKIFVFDKNDFEAYKVFEIRSQFVFHFDNAYEKDGSIVIHFPSYKNGEKAVGRDFKDVNALEIVQKDNIPQYNKLVLNMKTGKAEQELMDNGISEFPRIHSAYSQRENQWTLLVGNVDKRSTTNSDVMYVNNRTGKVESYSYPEGEIIEEHVITPKKNSASSGNERSVWILGMSHAIDKGHSLLNVFDGEMPLSSGPIATLALPYFQHFCFHGNYYDQSELG